MLPRAARLRKERDFRAVFSRANPQSPSSAAARVRTRTQSSPMMVVHARPRRSPSRGGRVSAGGGRIEPALDGSLRFGFSVSKKVAKRAHDRNRIKRRLSEIARLDVVPAAIARQNFDCVVVARIPAVAADYQALKSDFLSLLSKAGLIRPLVEDE